MDALRRVRLSDHFWAWEFSCRGTRCSCHGATQVDDELVRLLEDFRGLVESPISVLSGFRCDGHNRTVSGHPRSFHRVGMAADLSSFALRRDLEGWAAKLGELIVERVGNERGNVIWYERQKFIHVDVGRRIAELVRNKEAMLEKLTKGSGEV